MDRLCQREARETLHFVSTPCRTVPSVDGDRSPNLLCWSVQKRYDRWRNVTEREANQRARGAPCGRRAFRVFDATRCSFRQYRVTRRRGSRELFPPIEENIEGDELAAMGKQMDARFQEVVVKGYAAILPDNYEETAADLALTEEASAA